MTDYLKVVEALHGGFEKAMDECTRQAWGLSSTAPDVDPDPLTMAKLEEAMKLIPRRPSLELALVRATADLTENELDLMVATVQDYAKTMILYRRPAEGPEV